MAPLTRSQTGRQAPPPESHRQRHSLQRLKNKYSSRVDKRWPQRPRWPTARLGDLKSRGIHGYPAPPFNASYYLTVLQALLHLPAFLNLTQAHVPFGTTCTPTHQAIHLPDIRGNYPAVIYKHGPLHPTGCLACAISQLAEYYWSDQDLDEDGDPLPIPMRHLSLRPIRKLIRQLRAVRGYANEDEPRRFLPLLLLLIRECHTGYNWPPGTTPFNPAVPGSDWHQQFSALLMTTVCNSFICQHPGCGHDSSTVTHPNIPAFNNQAPQPPGTDFFLGKTGMDPLPSSQRPDDGHGRPVPESLVDILHRFFTLPNLAARQKNCPACGTQRLHRGRRVIVGAPEYLFININNIDRETNLKNRNIPTIPLTLNLTAYQHPETRNTPLKYKLSSIISGDGPTANNQAFLINTKRDRDEYKRVATIQNDLVFEPANHPALNFANAYEALAENPVDLFSAGIHYEATIVTYIRVHERNELGI